MNNKLDVEQSLLERVDILVRLHALSSVANFESQKDKILFLSKVGISPKEIADILGTTPNTVNVALSNARKGGKKSKSKQVNTEKN